MLAPVETTAIKSWADIDAEARTPIGVIRVIRAVIRRRIWTTEGRRGRLRRALGGALSIQRASINKSLRGPRGREGYGLCQPEGQL